LAKECASWNLFALITSLWRRSFEKRQADCGSGAGHLLAIIKPKIVRHTIILSTNNLFLLTPANFSKSPVCKPGCHKSFNSKFSFTAWYIPRDFSSLASSTFDAFSYDIAA
jgi:hypothetical protein